MKKALRILTSALALSFAFVGMTGCETDDTDNVSIVRNYPSLTLKGPAVSSIEVGSTYTDPGVTSLLNGQTLTPGVSGSVDSNTPGVYYIEYKAGNPEGDSVSAFRTVAVIDPAVNAVDLSGNYTRTNSAPVVWTKLGNGLYQSDNFGGVIPPSAFVQPAIFVHVTPTRMEFPRQVSPVGEVDFSGDTFTFDANGQLQQYKYVVLNGSFGAAPRTFNRQ